MEALSGVQEPAFQVYYRPKFQPSTILSTLQVRCRTDPLFLPRGSGLPSLTKVDACSLRLFIRGCLTVFKSKTRSGCT